MKITPLDHFGAIIEDVGEITKDILYEVYKYEYVIIRNQELDHILILNRIKFKNLSII